MGNIQGVVRNSWGILITSLCHKYHQNHSNKVMSINQNLATKSEFLPCLCLSVSLFLMCLCARPHFPIGFWNAVSKTIGHVLRIHSYTDCCQTHVCCKCWLHRVIWQFVWFWYLWPKMAFKMSQEFPAISLDWIYISDFCFFFVF